MKTRKLNPVTQCFGKVAHATHAAAWRAIRGMYPRRTGRLNAYRCPHCGEWHIGNRTKRRERAA